MRVLLYRFITLKICGFSNILQKLEKFLSKGNYTIDASFSIIYKKNNQEKTNTFDSLTLNSKVFNFLSKTISYKVLDNSEFNGDSIIISSSREEFKIFNKNKKLLLNFYKTPKKMGVVLNNRQKFNVYFATPTIIKQGDCYFIEKIIETEKIYSIDILFEKILSLYKKYYTQAIPKKINNELYYFQHGDLWSSNVLVNSQKIFFVDFEESNFFPYGYDLFFFMFQEAYIKNNHILLNKFFNGEYNQYFNYEGILDVSSEEKRKTVFKSFIKIYVKTRWTNISKRSKRNNLKKLSLLCKKYKINLETTL